MPPLSKMIRPADSGALPGFEPATQQPVPIMPESILGANRYLRTSLPPFNAGPDTLRQFNENGKTPTKRVIPLPIQTQAGGTTTINNNTTVISTGSTSSSGSGGSTVTKLSAATAILSIPSLLPGATFISTIIMAKSFQLLQLQASQAVEVRLYGDSATQNADLVRITDAPVPFQVVPGLITDIVFDSAPYLWNWQDRIGANADSPQSTTIYVTIINPSQVTALLASQITIQYLPLES